MLKKFLLVIITFFSINLQAFSIEKLYFNGFIADNAQVISETQENFLNALLYDLQQKTQADIAVVTLKTLNGEPIEDISLKIGREYKIGGEKLNNGAVVLVIPNDKQARIEIGYGLEGAITDAHAGRILDDYMLPYFRENDYEKGIVDGTTALAVDVAEFYGIQISASKPIPPDDYVPYDVILFLIIWLILIFAFGKGGGGFYTGSGFGSGGSSFGGFGGSGGFGGGGASRGW